MPQTADEAYTQLLRNIREAALLDSCAGILGWDERTYIPRGASAHRGEQMALLARLSHEMRTSPRIGELLSTVEESPLVRDNLDAAANVREIRRDYDKAVKLPGDLVEELARTTIRAQQAWENAREKSDFSSFQPWLEKMVVLMRRKADALGHSGERYDALLDEYEPGARTAEITTLFEALRPQLVSLMEAIQGSSSKPKREILQREYAVEKQRVFGEAAAAAIGFDFGAGRLDVTAHPFCSGNGPGDCRITTRYDPRQFNQAFFGILHEVGHGIYEQNLAAEHFGTPLGTAVSLGIHESQSRLWENQVGRSPAFWIHFFPRAQQVFHDVLRDVSLDDWVFAINEVRHSFIRVEADEASYNLHIILRFELEQALIREDLQAADVPGAWNEKFQQIFHCTPPDDAHGCLQDIHWSMGGMGYFPTYTLGNLYAAQFMEQARLDLGDLEEDFRRGEFGRLRHWLTEKIHLQGRRYPAGELCQRITGKPLDTQPLVQYLRGRYAPLYMI